MDDKNYQSILMKSPFGFAYHKITVDNQGTPVDYEFLEVNPAFERITGLKAKDIIGKTVCEVLPGIREGNFDCVQYYGDIALNGGSGEFEQYSKQLGSWHKVQAYSDQKQYFSTVFTDITAQKSLSDIAATFNDFSAQTINLQYVIDKAREISGAAFAVLNKFDEDGRGSSTLAVSGMNKHIEKAIYMLGFDPRGKRWDYDPERQKKIDNKKTTVFQQLTDLTGTAISKKIIALICKTLNIGQVAVVKTTRENIMLGDFTLIFKRSTHLKNRETIETYADLTGMLLSRIDEERRVMNEQARLKTITDNMTDLVWESDLQFINTYTSPSVNRIFGFSIEEYMPLTITERLTPESSQTALRLLQEELEKENDPRVSKNRSRLVELEYIRKDGCIIPMESNISFVRDKNGKPVGLRGVSRDITERRQAEEKLRENEEKYRALSEASFEAIFFSEKGICLSQNKNAEKLFGYTLSEAVGKSATDWIAPEDRQTVSDKILSGHEEPYEIRALRKDGSTFYAEMQGKMMHYQQRLVRITALRDITERRQAEEALREREEILKSIFINMTDVVWSISWPDLTHNYISPSLEKLYGRSKQELLDNPNLFQDITHPDDQHLTEKAIKQLLEEGKAERECRIIKPDGSIVWVNDRSKMIYDENQLPIRVDGVTRDITERKRAEQLLRESEMRFRSTFDKSPVGSVIVGLDKCFIKCNEAFCNFLGYTNDELIGKTIADITYSEDKELGMSDLKLLMEGKTESSSHIQKRYVHKDGFILWGEVSISLVRDGNNKPLYFLPVIADITERKQSELLLRLKNEEIATQNKELNQANQELITAKTKVEESESRFRQVSETAQELIWEMDHKGLYTYVSSAIESLLGYTPDEVIGKKYFYDLFIPQKREEYKQAAFKILAQRETVRNFENTMMHKNGQLVFVKTAGSPIFDDDENYKGYRGVDADITERKQVEKELHKSNQRLETLLEISQKVTSTIDQDLILQMLVNNAIRLIGLDTGAIYQKKDNETIRLSATTPALPNIFPDDLRNAYLKNHPHLNKALQTGKQVLMKDTLLAQLTSDEKKIVDLRKLRTIVYQPMMLRKNPIGVLILSSVETPRVFSQNDLKMLQAFANQAAHIIDNVNNYSSLKKHTHELEKQIKQREKAEQELVAAKEKAEEADKLKTAFINNISHEIRTPLNGILGFGQMLAESDLSKEKRSEYFEHVEKAGNRLMNTVNNYMDMALLVSNALEVTKKDFALEAVFEKITEKTKKLCAEKNIQFKLEIPKEAIDLTVHSDPEFIQKILDKLLENAIKFTKTGGIICGCQIKTERLSFFVKDTGRGIDNNKLDLIFEVFKQADTAITRGYEGSGLGLTIAKGLVRLLGGEIAVVSENGKGSVFSFTIPLTNADISLSHDETAATKPNNTEKPLILIAEDDESNYDYLAIVMELSGYNHIHAANGKEAVDLCKQNPDISLVLMDIKMPVMHGDEATRQIRLFRPELPIVATTAHAQTGDEHRFLEAGCNDYISKPIKKEKLLSIIRKYVE